MGEGGEEKIGERLLEVWGEEELFGSDPQDVKGGLALIHGHWSWAIPLHRTPLTGTSAIEIAQGQWKEQGPEALVEVMKATGENQEIYRQGLGKGGRLEDCRKMVSKLQEMKTEGAYSLALEAWNAGIFFWTSLRTLTTRQV